MTFADLCLPCVRDALILDEYRYWLTREWDAGSGTVNWIMLNPSTADAEVDDPTIRRCMGFSQAWGYRRIIVTNLWALRGSDPNELIRAKGPTGPDNAQHLRFAMLQSDLHVAAWGATVSKLLTAGKPRFNVEGMCRAGRKLWCLGKTKEGHPRHPLYLRRDTELELFA